MSTAMNGKNFESQLRNATLKLARIPEGDTFDQVSGFGREEIINFIVELPELGDETQLAQARAVLRRNGYSNVAEEMGV